MADYKIGNKVAIEVLEENIVEWAENEDLGFEMYVRNLMGCHLEENSASKVSYDIQKIGSTLHDEDIERKTADEIFDRIINADPRDDDKIFGLEPERAQIQY
ncbi:MAG: hypothetical protein R6V35_00425 [Candidatus Nanohaloarchaea archaeon]